jgi:hypothetical protein
LTVCIYVHYVHDARTHATLEPHMNANERGLETKL